MDKQETKWHANPWIIGIGTGLVVVFLSPIVDVLKEEKIFSTFQKVLTFLTKAQFTLGDISLPIWIFTIVLIVGFIIYKALRRIYKRDFDYDALDDVNLKKMLNYKAGRFNSRFWEWEWKYNGLINKYEVFNLTPHCTNCNNGKMELDYKNDGFKCSSCRRKCHSIYKKQIINNIYRKFGNFS